MYTGNNLKIDIDVADKATNLSNLTFLVVFSSISMYENCVFLNPTKDIHRVISLDCITICMYSTY